MTDCPAATGPAPTGPDAGATFYHGTRSDLAVGELLVAGWAGNYGTDQPLSWIYFSAALESAIWGCELAQGEARERIYIVEPTGDWFDDPNLTDKKFPGNPTRSYRSRAPLRIVGEVESWTPHAPDMLAAMKANIERLKAEGAEIID